VEVGANSPARGLLEPRDIILAVDGQKVDLVEEMVAGFSSFATDGASSGHIDTSLNRVRYEMEKPVVC